MSSHMLEHNGVTEWFNHTILDMVCCMLLGSSLPKNLWGEALSMAVTINNQLPTSMNDDTAPITWWDKMLNPSVKHLHHFGTSIQVLIPDNNCSKLNPKTRGGIYLGLA